MFRGLGGAKLSQWSRKWKGDGWKSSDSDKVNPCISKCGPRTRSISITWGLDRNANFPALIWTSCNGSCGVGGGGGGVPGSYALRCLPGDAYSGVRTTRLEAEGEGAGNVEGRDGAKRQMKPMGTIGEPGLSVSSKRACLTCRSSLWGVVGGGEGHG